MYFFSSRPRPIGVARSQNSPCASPTSMSPLNTRDARASARGLRRVTHSRATGTLARRLKRFTSEVRPATTSRALHHSAIWRFLGHPNTQSGLKTSFMDRKRTPSGTNGPGTTALEIGSPRGIGINAHASRAHPRAALRPQTLPWFFRRIEVAHMTPTRREVMQGIGAALALLPMAAQPQQNRDGALTLWYRTPAKERTEALIHVLTGQAMVDFRTGHDEASENHRGEARGRLCGLPSWAEGRGRGRRQQLRGGPRRCQIRHPVSHRDVWL